MKRSDETDPATPDPHGGGHMHQPTLSLGVDLRDGGAEFRVFSRHASQMSLLLFDGDDRTAKPTARIAMQGHGDVWKTFVAGIRAGQRYAFQARGPNDPAHGHLFDAQHELLDPYAKAFATVGGNDAVESLFVGDGPTRARSVVVDDQWSPPIAGPRRPQEDWIVYEAHLRGMTAHDSSGSSAPGTYLGLIDKLDYLSDLGVTAIELLPIHEFDPREYHRVDPTTGKRITNYWGYSTVGFFSPHGPYAASKSPDGASADLLRLASEIHSRGMEVVLDVVFNHTGEGDAAGPTLHFKGLDNAVFYHHGDDRSQYRDYTGCGNTLRCNNPAVRPMILDSLRYFATRFGIDGFRFDLAAALTRDDDGGLSVTSPLIREISEDPILRDVKLIAEPWDAAGGYLLGGFPPHRWSEWNGAYRDDVRRFWRGEPGRTGQLATRLMGSSDVFFRGRPRSSVNFFTSHDGFTLADLCTYTAKRNLANGEDNRDGENNNFGTNFGVEGETDDARVVAERTRYAKNMFATLLLSQGTPMIAAGDEFGRTQRGNNNAYCQDNEISWIDWRLLETNRDLHDFVRRLIWFRRRHPVFRRSQFFKGVPRPERPIPDVAWFDADARPKDWGHDDQTLMCHLDGVPPDDSIDPLDHEMLLLFNASGRPRVAGSESPHLSWRVVFDTGSSTSPCIHPEGLGPILAPGHAYGLTPRSMALFHRPLH
jgi:isoamylase